MTGQNQGETGRNQGELNIALKFFYGKVHDLVHDSVAFFRIACPGQ